MSEGDISEHLANVALRTAASESSPGAMLRAARESQGMHIAMLSVALKVPVRKLEALESDRFDLLPDMVFVRALAASVCRALRIDAEPILAALPANVAHAMKIDDAGLNAVYDDPSRVGGRNWMNPMQKPLGIGVGIVILAIFVVAFVPESLVSDYLSSATQEKTTGESVAESKLVQLGVSPYSAEVKSTEVLQSVSVKQVEPMSAALPQSQASLPLNAPLAEPPLPQAPRVVASQVAGSHSLVLQAVGDSWVEVKDAQGITLLKRILNKGELVPVNGMLPFSVVLGRADLVSVLIKGQPFDARAVTKENVARFEVK